VVIICGNYFDTILNVIYNFTKKLKIAGGYNI